MDNKVMHGQFYTTVNPFGHEAFFRWIEYMKVVDQAAFDSKWVEPFAGANNIVEMIQDVSLKNANNASWECFDIEPMSQDQNTSGVDVQKLDTLSNFPKGFSVAITNPPYLAKNSATRRGLDFPKTSHDDLYKFCLDVILQNCGWAAAIIPDSFLTQKLFHNRLFAVISLTHKMFEDTEVPVCLALFAPEELKGNGSFGVWRDNKFLGKYCDLAETLGIIHAYNDYAPTFNDPKGTIGLLALDSTSGPSIKFVLGSDIKSSEVSEKNRSFTRISVNSSVKDVAAIVKNANKILSSYRDMSEDVFMTAFKGLRKDKKYRRRLDWATARRIINKAIETV